MEEKERYEVMSPSLNGYAYIHDLKTDNVLNTYDSCDLLNQQSKRIKELEEELENYKLCRCVDCSTEYEKGLETSIDELENENQQLKQQLKESESKRKSLEEKVKWLSEENEECFIDGQKYNELREQKDKEIAKLKQSQKQLANYILV